MREKGKDENIDTKKNRKKKKERKNEKCLLCKKGRQILFTWPSSSSTCCEGLPLTIISDLASSLIQACSAFLNQQVSTFDNLSFTLTHTHARTHTHTHTHTLFLLFLSRFTLLTWVHCSAHCL